MVNELTLGWPARWITTATSCHRDWCGYITPVVRHTWHAPFYGWNYEKGHTTACVQMIKVSVPTSLLGSIALMRAGSRPRFRFCIWMCLCKRDQNQSRPHHQRYEHNTTWMRSKLHVWSVPSSPHALAVVEDVALIPCIDSNFTQLVHHTFVVVVVVALQPTLFTASPRFPCC